MRTIWKFKLINESTIVGPVSVYEFEYPPDSVVLDVQIQGYGPVFWVELDTDLPTETQRLAVVGTGLEIPEFATGWEGTWQQYGLVWHLYSVDEELYQLALTNEAAS